MQEVQGSPDRVYPNTDDSTRKIQSAKRFVMRDTMKSKLQPVTVSPEAWSIDDLTPERFSHALSETLLAPISVVDVAIEREISLGLGRAFVVTLNYAEGANRDDVGPPSLFVKLGQDEVADSELLRVSKKEVDFYGRVAPLLGLSSLACYGCGFDESTGRSHLILEDYRGSYRLLADVEQGSLDHLLAAVDSLAARHAKCWNHFELGYGAGRWWTTQMASHYRTQLLDILEQGVRANPFLFTPLRVKLYRSVLDESAWQRLSQSFKGRMHVTLCHGDVHPGNILQPKDGGPSEFIDWQTYSVSPGPFDLAHLLTFSMPTEQRLACERHVLSHYYQAVIDGGVRDYSEDKFVDDYRLGMLRNAIALLSMWKFGGIRPSELADWFDRVFDAVAGTNAASLVLES